MSKPTSKTCKICGVQKPLSEYYREARSSDGRRYECKGCSYKKKPYTAKYAVNNERFGASHWLAQEINTKRFQQETKRAFEDAVGRPSAYELRNMGSGHGMPVDLGDERFGVFWSKGWRGCEFNCGKRVDDWNAPMYVTVKRHDGTIVWRKSCTPNTQEE